MARYIAYKNGQYVGAGTFEELAHMTGRSPRTLRSLHSRPNKIWEIVRDDYYIELGEVNIDLIKNKLHEHDILHKELAFDLNISKHSLSCKMRNEQPWNIDELEKVSELLNIRIGNLLK